MSDERVAIVWTTLPVDSDVTRFSKTLVEERLAACVSAKAGIRSVYRWGGDIEENDENQLWIKTTVSRLDQLRDRLYQLHPYEVPEFLVTFVDGGSSIYLDWVRDSISS